MITRSRGIDRLRKDSTVHRIRSLARQELPVSIPAHRTGDPVLHRERRLRIRRALNALPREQRLVLDLAYFRGLTQNEIADQTGVPLGTVKTRTVLAMKKLRVDLEGELRGLL